MLGAVESPILLPFGLCVVFFPVFLGCVFFPILGLCIAATVFIVKLWLLEYPSFGLLLSCFGHVRAKNNSVFPCGLELC